VLLYPFAQTPQRDNKICSNFQIPNIQRFLLDGVYKGQINDTLFSSEIRTVNGTMAAQETDSHEGHSECAGGLNLHWCEVPYVGHPIRISSFMVKLYSNIFTV